VVGVDVSPPVLGAARGAAAKAGTTNVEFVEADVQEEVPAGPFDGVFSRFGVMFFSEPERAFANLHGVTKPGGRMAFACWAGLAENPWFVVPMMAIAGVPGLQLPPPPAPDAPGPFSLADTDRVRRILEAGGWRNVETESWTSELVLADDAAIDFRVQFTMRQGPAAVALANADVPTLAEVATRVRSALEEHRTDGVVRLGRKAWIVTALF
jgi:SAM-dependent methyltransferase